MRKKNKLTQQELADKLEVSKDLIKSVESDRSNLSVQNLIKIIQFFNINANDFLFKDLEIEDLSKQ